MEVEDLLLEEEVFVSLLGDGGEELLLAELKGGDLSRERGNGLLREELVDFGLHLEDFVFEGAVLLESVLVLGVTVEFARCCR